MNVNISYINIELNKIIQNTDLEYDNKIILYALIAIKYMKDMCKTNKVSYDFIKIMKHLKEQIKCYVDFEFFEYAWKNNKKIRFCDHGFNGKVNKSLSSNNYLTNGLTNNIDKMLKKD